MNAPRIAITTLALSLLINLHAQVTFIRTYDQPADLQLRGSCTTPDDGLILTGVTGPDGFLMRLDRFGNVRWLKTYSSIGVDFAGSYTGEPYDEQTFEDVTVLANGDLFVAGSANLDVQGPTGTSMLMARFDSLGTPIWARTTVDSHNETLLSTALLDAHSAIVGGRMSSLFGSSGEVYRVDLDSARVTHGFKYDDIGYAAAGKVSCSPDGAMLVAIGSDAGYALHKLTDSLSTIWQGCWAMNDWMPVALVGTPSGCTVAAGAPGVVRYGPLGSPEWAVSITATPPVLWKDLVLRPNGHLVLLGSDQSSDPSSYLVELDSTGVVQWSARYGAAGDTINMSRLHLLPDGSLRMVGTAGQSHRPMVIATDTVGGIDACSYPPPSFSFGVLSPSQIAAGAVYTWGAMAIFRHDELGSADYVTSTLICAGNPAGYQATGMCFIDLDQDGIAGPAEPPAPWQLVQVSPNSGGVFSNNAANYLFAPQDSGTYVLSPPLPAQWWQLSSDSASYTVHLGSLTPTVDSLDFGWIATTDTTVIEASIVPVSSPCMGFGPAIVNLLNQGTTRPDLLISLTLDPLFAFSTPYPAPDSAVGNTLYWHVDTLGLFAAWQSTLTLQAPGFQSIGDTAHSVVDVFEIDSLGALHIVSSQPWVQIITCAYDPNDKLVEPKGDGAWGGIDAGTDWLTYTVRFQNTGNDTAQTVVIEDDLSGALQWSTLQVLGASHDLTGVSVGATGKAVFRFDGIQLPDSGASQTASHGFVRFRVRPVTGLPHLASIDNNAGIFFDLNPPVITNTVRNTIINCAQIDWQASVFVDIDALYAYTYFMDTMSYAYQWLLNGAPVNGATQAYLQPQQSGDYSVAMTDEHGCTSSSVAFPYIATVVIGAATAGPRILPNPMNDKARVQFTEPLSMDARIVLVDAQGRVVRSLRGNGTTTLTIDRGDLAPGLYVLRVEGLGAARFVVE